MTGPLRLSFVVSCEPATAFRTWTSRASTWWPQDHSVSGERGTTVIFEGRKGGRIFERTPSGVEHEWGTVTAWAPPSRLAYTWHIHFAPEEATDVEIRFVDIGDNKTRVEIDHQGWERLGNRAQERQEGNRRGWASVLPYFVEAAETFAHGRDTAVGDIAERGEI